LKPSCLISRIGFVAIIFLFQITNSWAQYDAVTLSGLVKEPAGTPLPFANVVLRSLPDSAFKAGTITNENGRFTLSRIAPGNYLLDVSSTGFQKIRVPLFVGSITDVIELRPVEMKETESVLKEVTITGKQDEVSGKMDRKSFSLSDNVSQTGGSVVQAMQNLPGITVQDGKVQLRGNERVTILIDGKQTALTGFGSQSGLDNLPASSFEKIEIIQNPSARYDANGNAGIINLVSKKETREGWNGKFGLTGGMGALWIRKENLPGIRPQYQATPKINPSLAVNYRKKNVQLFFQGDYLYTQTLNKNEFVTRTYSDGTVIEQQTKRNRNTHFVNAKLGMDWNMSKHNQLTVSGILGTEKIIDRGDEPFFRNGLSNRYRLWQFLEDELKTTFAGSVAFQHKFTQPGHLLNASLNYSFHRENERYDFDNILPTFRGKDAFRVLSDENVTDLNLDYVRPLPVGRFEGGFKFRERYIPTNMSFYPGLNSPLDSNAGGWATYTETIPALYGNYLIETRRLEAEVGMRVEYVKLQYDVNPNHNTYKSNGYNYMQPFPNIRLGWKISENHKITAFFNRRVDRPTENDIRIFPKYDDAEIIKVGNPGLRPQFTNRIEVGYKTSLKKGYFYAAAYHTFADGTITRIASTVSGSPLVYNIFQNVGKSYNTGLEAVLSMNPFKWYTFTLNLNAWHNQINGFTVLNQYPVANTFTAGKEEIYTGTLKWNSNLHLPGKTELQISAIDLAPDLIPQGKIQSRFSVDIGIKRPVRNGKGEWFLNGSNILNTMVIRKTVNGQDFRYVSRDYNETQVFRLGYSQKF